MTTPDVEPNAHVADGSTRRIAICALTYLRPVGLQTLLAGVDRLAIPEGTSMRVIVVDNDPEASARPAVEAHVSPLGAVEYLHEPARGISTARNAAIAAARRWKADLICFLDDDEWPEPDWLTQYLGVLDATGADVVTGPVFSVFDEPPPDWVTEGGFFDRRRHAHLEEMNYATTSTVMIRLSVLDDDPFDEEFGLSGGEDTHLFAELRAAGRSIVWCDTGHVHESIPATKVNASWILRREYRRGQTLSLSLRRRDRSTWRVIRRIGNGALHVGAGIGLTVIGAFRGKARAMIGIERMMFGVGMWTGLAGRRYAEYETTHGS